MPKIFISFAILLFLTFLKDTKSASREKYRETVINYPRDSVFFATDFFVKGCRNFLDNCPSGYKIHLICAKSYNDEMRTFDNYCLMQYENCNTWKNWHVYKRERC